MRITAKCIGKGIVKIINSLVNLAVLVTILLLVAVACYALWDSNQVYTAADAKQYEIYKPSEEDTVSFDELRAVNSEVFSWLTVYGTNIDYPVAQSPDIMKYVNTDVYGNYSLSGAIFLDSGNSQDYSDFNSIFYGHHMEKQAMFGELDKFSDKSFFDSHLYGNLFFGGKDHGLEFFAFYHTDAYDSDTFTPNILGEESQREFLHKLLDKAIHKRDIGVSVNDRIVLLTTCSSESTNGRDILAARITQTVYDDPFNQEEILDNKEAATVDAQIGQWERIPLWVKLSAPALLLILLVVSIYIMIKRKRKG